jgi:hypothetical protein
MDGAFKYADCRTKKCNLGNVKFFLTVEHVATNCIQRFKDCFRSAIPTVRFQCYQEFVVLFRLMSPVVGSSLRANVLARR